MTALKKYQRLECPGIWRADETAQRRDVFVSLGEATLIIKDKADVALAHWSLPAVECDAPGDRPAVYRPGEDADETLEIDDPDMIDAIGTVRRSLGRSRPHPGRLRLTVLTLIFIGIVALGIFWLPGALVHYAAAIIPETTRQDVGRRILSQLEPVSGTPCRAREGRRALSVLQNRLFRDAPWNIVVISGGPAMTAHLPGGMLLIHRDMIEDASAPEVTAGALLAEAARADTLDPMTGFMEDAGPWAILKLLTTGSVEDQAIRDYARHFLTDPAIAPSEDRIVTRFTEASVPPQPWLAEARPRVDLPALVSAEISARPVLGDADWVRLQGICQR